MNSWPRLQRAGPHFRAPTAIPGLGLEPSQYRPAFHFAAALGLTAGACPVIGLPIYEVSSSGRFSSAVERCIDIAEVTGFNPSIAHHLDGYPINNMI